MPCLSRNSPGYCAMLSPLVVTLDGPAGVGKSTLARNVAGHLGIAYMDTGAMFRTIALGLKQHIHAAERCLSLQGPALEAALQQFTFSLQGNGEKTTLLCNNHPVGNEIRSEEAGLMAAAVAVSSEVRTFLKTAQQALGAHFSLVAEGRDMGTEVFPQASCKIFLDASPEVRAQRRFLQLQEMGSPADLPTLTAQIAQRDAQDRNRAIAPLRPAADAVIIDTSALSLEEVFQTILQAVQAKKPGPCTQ